MHPKIVIPSLPTAKPSTSNPSSQSSNQTNTSTTNEKDNPNQQLIPHQSIQLRKSLFQQEIPLHYHSTFSSTHLLTQIKNPSLFQQPTTSNTNNPHHALIGNNHRLVQLRDNNFVLTAVAKPKQPQQNATYVDRYARATEIDAEDREMLTEVANVLNKIIYYVTFNTSIDDNMELMNQMEVCWAVFL